MTDPQPYTAEQCGDVADALRAAALLDDWPTFDSDLRRLAATLREYQRVLAEIAALRADKERLDWLEQERCDVTFQKRADVDGDEVKVNRWTVWPYGGRETSLDWDGLRAAIDAARSGGKETT